MSALVDYSSSEDGDDVTEERSNHGGIPTSSRTQSLAAESKKPQISGAYVSRRKRMETGSPSEEVRALSDISKFLWDTNAEKRTRLASTLPKCHETLPREHCKPVVSLDWHPYNSTLLLSCALDGSSILWDSRSMKSIQRFCPNGGAGISCGEWVTSHAMASAGYDKRVTILDVEKNQNIASFAHCDYVSALKVHPVNKNIVFSGDYGAGILSWDLRAGKNVKKYEGAGGKILDLAVLPSGIELLASADIVRKNSYSQAVRVWEIESGVPLSQQVYTEPYTCPCLRVHPHRNEFYAQSNANYIVIFTSKKPYKCNKHKRFESHQVDGNRVLFDVSPDGRLLCSGSANGCVMVYNCDTAQLLKSLPVSSSSCIAVAWNKYQSSVIAISDWSSNVIIAK